MGRYAYYISGLMAHKQVSNDCPCRSAKTTMFTFAGKLKPFIVGETGNPTPDVF